MGGNIFVLWGLLMTEPEMTHIPKGPGSELPVRGAAAEVSEHSGKPWGKLSPRTKSGSHAGHVLGGCSQLLSLGSLEHPLSLLFLFLFPSLFCIEFILMSGKCSATDLHFSHLPKKGNWSTWAVSWALNTSAASLPCNFYAVK